MWHHQFKPRHFFYWTLFFWASSFLSSCVAQPSWQRLPWLGLEVMYLNTEKEFSDFLDDSVALALTANVPLNDRWVLELEGRHFARDGEIDALSVTGEARTYRYHAGLKYLLPPRGKVEPFLSLGGTYSYTDAVSASEAVRTREREPGGYARLGFEMDPTPNTVLQLALDVDDSFDVIGMAGFRLRPDALVFVRGEIDVENEFGYVSAGVGLGF